jgi:class 3 adenylate cyclase/predicted ATPase
MDERVVRWLETLGVGKYASVFAENEVTFEVLPRLTDADLKELGLPLGPRRVLSDALAALVSSTAADDVPETATLATGRSAAERRQLTVMFVDLVGSTALSARLDPEEMGNILRSYQNAVAGEIARLEGHVAKFMGDGVLAYFGWPVAHEDEAERAVRAGLAIVAAVGRLTGGGTPLACRIGLATGLVVVGELIGEGVAQEQTVVGETPNLAARLQALAAPGQVVVGKATRRLLGAGFLLDDLGAQALKGIEGAVSAFAVIGERVLASRFEGRAAGLQPMVGRDQELALLLERWAQAASGEGQAVLLVGEAGVGKSRISRALLDALGERPHTRIRYQCSPYHTGSALWPAIQQLEHAARFAPADPLETKLDNLEAALGGERAAESTALIARLVGLDGTARYGALELAPAVLRARTLEALVRQLLQLAAARPVLLLIEDAHWADPTTLELIEQWLDAIAAAPVLLVLTRRPDNQPALAAHPHVTRLSLNRLGRAGVEAIVARLGGDRLPPATVDAIIARTDGVPLYVEELTKAILETGETAIPASLHDSLMARLDRIPEVKEIAQIAACIGREFDYALLAAVAAQPEPKVRDALERLAAAELIFRRGSPPEAHYTFKHALVRDAAYESLLRSRREETHRVVYRALTGVPEIVSADALAIHAAGAGQFMDAARHGLDAGRHALARWAVHEAAQHLRRALEHLGRVPAGADRDALELELQRSLAPALLAALGYSADETGNAYARTAELARAAQQPATAAQAQFGSFLFHLVGGDLDAASGVAREMLAATEADAGSLAMAYRVAGTCAFFTGEFELAALQLDDAAAHLATSPVKPTASQYVFDPATSMAVFSSLTLLALGQLSRAEALQVHSRSLAEAGDHVATTAFVHHHGCFFAMASARPDVVQTLAAEMLQLAERERLSIWLATGRIYQGWSAALTRQDEDAVRIIDEGLARWRATGARLWLPVYLALRADALVAVRRQREAAVSLAQARDLATETPDRHFVSEIHRRMAVVHLATGDRDAAERALVRARQLAAEQRAKLYQLRATRDRARLWADQGKRQQARDLLAPVYGWFTEGFDTPDLVEAKALLDELH